MIENFFTTEYGTSHTFNRSQQFSYTHFKSSVADSGVRKDLSNNYVIYGFYHNDSRSKLCNTCTVTPTYGKITFNVYSYESNQTACIYYNESAKTSVLYFNDSARDLPNTNSIQALHYITVKLNSVN